MKIDQEAEEYSQTELHEKNEGPADEILFERAFQRTFYKHQLQKRNNYCIHALRVNYIE